MLDILKVSFTLLACLSGIACGWMLAVHRRASPNEADPPETEGTTVSANLLNDASERIGIAAVELQQVATGLNSRIGEHQDSLGKIGVALSSEAEAPSLHTVTDCIDRLFEANGQLRSKLDEAREQVQNQSDRLRKLERELLNDGLTGIQNRRGLDLTLEACYRDRHRNPTTLMLLDIDRFKSFNDQYGHLTGDEVLRQVAEILHKAVGEAGQVARFGGEEFAVVFRQRALEDCLERGEVARLQIAEHPVFVSGQAVRITASAGFAEIESQDTLQEWVERADTALYRAKSMGRDRSFSMQGDRAKPVTGAQPAASPSPRSAELCLR